jgi:hypothetical protein
VITTGRTSPAEGWLTARITAAARRGSASSSGSISSSPSRTGRIHPSVALFGAPVLGKLLNSISGPGEMWLPSQVGVADIAEIRNTTEQLRSAARARGGQARAVSAAAIEYGRLTQVPAAEPIVARLGSALAELNTLTGLRPSPTRHAVVGFRFSGRLAQGPAVRLADRRHPPRLDVLTMTRSAYLQVRCAVVAQVGRAVLTLHPLFRGLGAKLDSISPTSSAQDS